MLPQISPSPLTSLKEPIGHPNWIYELKQDGFRGILYVDREQAWLVSPKGKKFRQFDPLLKQVLRSKPLPSGCSADWYHRTTPIYCTWSTWKKATGVRFFRPVCKQDLEGFICKPKASPYPFTWIKVKNPSYSQAVGRREWFERLLAQR